MVIFPEGLYLVIMVDIYYSINIPEYYILLKDIRLNRHAYLSV